MFAQEQSDQGLQCLLKSNLITVYKIPEKQFDLGLQCFLKSILTRVYNVWFSVQNVCSWSSAFPQEHSDQGLPCLLKSSLIRVRSFCLRAMWSECASVCSKEV